MIDSINSRVREVRIRFCGDSNVKFARHIGKKPNTVNNWIRPGYSVGRGVISQIIEAFPMVNPVWLASGEGDMFRYQLLKEDKLTDNGKVVPFYDIDAMPANCIDKDSEMLMSCPFDTINVGWMLKDSEAAMRVYGDSMSPNFPSGCIVGLRPHNDSFIEPGNVYIIDTRDHRYMRRLYMNSQKDAYRCVSDNYSVHESGPMKGEYIYPDFEIPLKSVVRLHLVVGMIKRDTI